MKFRNLIIKNISRNKSRSILAIIGIAIGVAAVVGLGLITNGLSASTQSALTAGAADFSIINGTSSDNGGPGGGFGNEQLISQSTINDIQQISGVNSAVGVLRTEVNLNNSASSSTSSSENDNGGGNGFGGNFRSMTSVIGINNNDISMNNMVITNGTVFSGGNQVILGTSEAQRLNKTVGDTITISNQTFNVVGIYQTGNFMDDRGIAMSLDELQNLTGDSGQVSLILIKANNGTNVNDLESAIQQQYSNQLTASYSLSGVNRMNNALNVINSGAWIISLLAILVGGIIVVVTMMKAVSERTREIGVLRAIGWTKSRIMKMILGEALILSLVAVIVGLIIGIGLIELITASHIIRGITPAFSPLLILEGIGIAIFLGIAGAIYPAFRASRLPPTEALRYE